MNMKQCDCANVCMWTCNKAFHCKSRIMRDYAEILPEDYIDDDEEEETDDG